MSGMDLKRRRVVQGLGAGLLLPALGAPAVIASPRARPKLTDGVQSGDVQGDRAGLEPHRPPGADDRRMGHP